MSKPMAGAFTCCQACSMVSAVMACGCCDRSEFRVGNCSMDREDCTQARKATRNADITANIKTMAGRNGQWAIPVSRPLVWLSTQNQ